MPTRFLPNDDVTERFIFATVLLSAIACSGCGSSSQQSQPKLSNEAREPVEQSHHLPDEVKAILDNAEQFTLFSIEGNDVPSTEKSDRQFHGYNILGSSDIESPEERHSLLTALYQSVADATNVAFCFYPRHAIRATLGNETVDLLICFECHSIHVFGKQQHGVWTTDEAAVEFNAALKRHNLQAASLRHKPPPESAPQPPQPN